MLVTWFRQSSRHCPRLTRAWVGAGQLHNAQPAKKGAARAGLPDMAAPPNAFEFLTRKPDWFKRLKNRRFLDRDGAGAGSQRDIEVQRERGLSCYGARGPSPESG